MRLSHLALLPAGADHELDRYLGVKFMLVVFACLFVAVQVMFEYRSVLLDLH